MRWGYGVILIALAGCAGPTGPVVGDWRGYQLGLTGLNNLYTQLILDGEPDAQSGTYHLVTKAMEPGLTDDPRWNVRWTDHWERRTLQVAQAQTYISIHLFNAPNAETPDYLLTSNGSLLPVPNTKHPDLSPEAMKTALVPLPRTSWGFGRP